MNRDLQKAEAIERMRMLHLHSNVINEFRNQGRVNLSEFEKKHNALVYHVIHNNTVFGEMLAFLYVSDSEEEWDMDRGDLKNGITLAYVENVSNKCCSEFGSIGIQPSLGGLVRTE